MNFFMPDLTQLTRLELAEVCAAVGAVGGALNYWLKTVEGKPFIWKELMMHVATSAFSGWIAYEIFDYMGLPPGLSAALCGLSGWMGTRLLRIVEAVLKAKAGVDKSNGS